jgi:PucR family transcriptional regulator, purine catabolism regulatory protein
LGWTVDQLLQDPGLRLRTVVRAHGARPISWVHPTELPDPTPYLRGGEVVLTTGMWLDTGTPPSAFVAALARSAVVAIGFGLSVGHLVMPRGLEEACRDHDMTLFEVPLDVSFQTLVRAFVLHNTREGVVPLRAAVRHNQAFVSALGEGKGIPGVLEIIRRDLGAETHLWDPRGQLIAGTSTTDAGIVDRAWTSVRRRNQRIDLGEIAVVPIGPRGAREALMLIERPLERMSAADVAEVEQAVSFIGLELGRRRAIRETVRRFTADVVEGLFAGDVDGAAVYRHLAMLGFEPDSPVFLVVSSVEDCPEPLDCLDAAFGGIGVRSGSSSVSGRLVSFAQVRTRDFDARSVGSAVSESLGPRACVGVGSLALEPADLRRSLLEADYACRLAMRRGSEGGRHAAYDEVGSHLLLLALLDRDVLTVYRRAVLQPLLDHDSRGPVNLVETLRVYLASGQQSTSSASQLGIHVNTLKHRLGLVERLTGRDLRSTADVADLYLALGVE